MKPPDFDYERPASVAEALALLADGRDVSVLAGGQSLIRLLNLRLVRPDVLVDINRIPELTGTEVRADSVRVAAMTRMRDVETDLGLRAALPILPEAVALVGHPQIRNRGTIGGSLCHADPVAELPTVATALDARLHLASVRGERVLTADEFHRSPFATSRGPDELLTAVEFPRHPGFRFRFLELSRRPGDVATVAVCLGVRTDGDLVTDARIAAAGVAGRPVRLRQAERALTGRRLAARLDEVLDAAVAEVDPPSDQRATATFRSGLLRTAIRRAAAGLAAREGDAG